MLIISKSKKMQELFKKSNLRFVVDDECIKALKELATIKHTESYVETFHIPNSNIFLKFPENITTKNILVSIKYVKEKYLNIYFNNTAQLRTHTIVLNQAANKQRNELSLFTFRYNQEINNKEQLIITFKEQSIF